MKAQIKQRVAEIAEAHRAYLEAELFQLGQEVKGARYDDYDELVDNLVESTDGTLTAFETDPLTAQHLTNRGINLVGKSYNDMCEIEGNLAFGQ